MCNYRVSERSLEKLKTLAVQFREQVRTGFEVFNQEPASPKLTKKRRELQKKIIHAIVERVDVFEDKSVQVHFLIDLPGVVEKGELVYISDELTIPSTGLTAMITT